MKIKVITYNIWHGTHLEKVIEFLHEEKPDVVQLQEVGTLGRGFKADETVNMWNTLQQELGMKGEYRRMFWEKHGHDLGIATFSRFPILNTVDFSYEREQDGAIIDIQGEDRYWLPRVLMGVELHIAGSSLWSFNTHFTITKEALVTERQLESARSVKGFLEHYPEFILTGDMNTPYQTETYQVLSNGLVDVSNPFEPTLHPTIHKVGEKAYHVDYVFYKGTRIKHLDTRVPIVDGSDHLPVVVELEIK